MQTYPISSDMIIRILGTGGVISSQIMNLSVIPSLIEIIRSGSTLAYPSFPVIIGLTNAIHNILYALSRSDEYVIISSVVSFILYAIYFCVHARYVRDSRSFLRQFFYFPFLSTILSMIMLEFLNDFTCLTPNGITDCINRSSDPLGSFSTIISTLSYCGQLTTIRRIIRTKDASSISPWMTGGVLLRASTWFLYSYMIDDKFYLISTSVGIVSALVQIGLLINYRRRKRLD